MEKILDFSIEIKIEILPISTTNEIAGRETKEQIGLEKQIVEAI